MRKFLKFFPVASALAALSKDRSTKVGAVALGEDYEILSTGYNGFPRGVNDDTDERHERPMKYKFTAHAESNLVAQAARNGVSLRGATVLVTSLFPCTHCSKMLIQSGVRRVIAPKPGNDPRNIWSEEAAYSKIMFDESKVEVIYVKETDRPDGVTVWEIDSLEPGGVSPDPEQDAPPRVEMRM